MGAVPAFTVRDSPMETKEQNLLWDINKMREHDGLKPFEDMADLQEEVNADIVFVAIEE